MTNQHCERCKHTWTPRIYRGKEEEPRVCPKCHSPYWKEKRRLKYDWERTHKKVIKV